MDYVYLVNEIIDVDGGFGDAIRTEEPVKVFRDEKAANDFVSENSHPEVYDSPYNDLWHGGLEVVKLPYVK